MFPMGEWLPRRYGDDPRPLAFGPDASAAAPQVRG